MKLIAKIFFYCLLFFCIVILVTTVCIGIALKEPFKNILGVIAYNMIFELPLIAGSWSICNLLNTGEKNSSNFEEVNKEYSEEFERFYNKVKQYNWNEIADVQKNIQKNFYKERVIKGLVEIFNYKFKYVPFIDNENLEEELFNLLKKSDGVFEETNHRLSYKIDDYIYCDSKENLFKLFNITFDNSKINGNKRICSSLFSEFVLNQDINSKILIKTAKTPTYYSKLPAVRMTNNMNFARHFEVYSDNELKTKQILSYNNIMNKLYEIYQKSGLEMIISIKENKIYLTVFIEDMFEPTINKNFLDKKYLNYNFNILDMIFTINNVLKESIKNI